MITIKSRTVVKGLAALAGVLSALFLLFVIYLRVQVGTTGQIPIWLIKLYGKNGKQLKSGLILSNEISTGLVLAVGVLYALIGSKIGLSAYLWKSVPKEFDGTMKPLMVWAGFTVIVDIPGFGLLTSVLSRSSALEFKIISVYLLMMWIVDFISILAVLWLRHDIQKNPMNLISNNMSGLIGQFGGRTRMACEHPYANASASYYGYNPNHNLKPLSIC